MWFRAVCTSRIFNFVCQTNATQIRAVGALSTTNKMIKRKQKRKLSIAQTTTHFPCWEIEQSSTPFRDVLFAATDCGSQQDKGKTQNLDTQQKSCQHHAKENPQGIFARGKKYSSRKNLMSDSHPPTYLPCTHTRMHTHIHTRMHTHIYIRSHTCTHANSNLGVCLFVFVFVVWLLWSDKWTLTNPKVYVFTGLLDWTISV